MPRLNNRPAISIGLPVYNGAKFIAEAFDSLLSQTFRDFELIISDNASTDDTRAICEAYVARDGRITYTRQPRNFGATFNWNFVVHAARGGLFKWASANDWCEPTMLEDCALVLNENPGVVLCYGTTMLMDDDGRPIGTYEGDPEIMDDSPSQRFWRLLTELSMNNAQSGLIEVGALRSTRLERHYPAGDQILMAELALRGRYRKLPKVLLSGESVRSPRPSFSRRRSSVSFMIPMRARTRWSVGVTTPTASAPHCARQSASGRNSRRPSWRCAAPIGNVANSGATCERSAPTVTASVAARKADRVVVTRELRVGRNTEQDGERRLVDGGAQARG